MSLLTLQNLSFDYGGDVVFEGVNLTVHKGERYGLVGGNGAGKSTLMRLIIGEMDPVQGRLERGGHTRVGYLEQDTALDSDQPLRDAVREKAFGELLRLEVELNDLGSKLGDAAPDLMERYGELHERFEQADGYTMDSRTDAALHGLGFDLERLDQPVQQLSGGQKRRAALAAILLTPLDVLLLDEPTNHLDLEAREWLESHLRERGGAMIAISHDRAFLDNATECTLHLVKGRLNRFGVPYTKFQKAWREQKLQWEEQYRRQREQIQKTEAFIRKNIAGQKTNQAKSRRKQLDRLERVEAPPNEGQQLRMHIAPARESGSLVFEGRGLAQRFGELELFRNLDLQILRGEKIGILGPNGTGKTTLLRILSRENAPAEGSLVTGTNVDIGFYDQDLRLVSDQNTVLREIHQLDPTTPEGDIRSMLGAFQFSADMVDQPVHTLSGGERARLSLLKLILQRHNVLLLDEPTNHLDTETREAMEEALVGFAGTLIVVSHDRYFLNRICDRIIAFSGKAGGGDGELRQFLGNYDDYRYRLAAEREVAAKPAAKSAAIPPERPLQRAARKKRDLSNNELRKVRREIHDLEEEIALIETNIELSSETMSGGSLSGEEMAGAAARVKQQQSMLEQKMSRWEELTEFMERDR
jgi:ATP-binding cassette subfamily F protein 3